jgi:hypothetical protein
MEVKAHLVKECIDIIREAEKVQLYSAHLGGGKDDHSPVDTRLVTAGLGKAAREFGYTVHLVPCVYGRFDVLGMTDSEVHKIFLRDDMTDASTVRTFCHELTHAAISASSGVEARPSTDAEEWTCELTASLVTRTLGCTDNVFSSRYLRGHWPQTLSEAEAAADAALGVAEYLLETIHGK